MSTVEAIEKLEILLEQLTSLPLDAQSSEFKKWKRRADRYIEDIFRANDRGQFSEFLEIEFVMCKFHMTYLVQFMSLNL